MRNKKQRWVWFFVFLIIGFVIAFFYSYNPDSEDGEGGNENRVCLDDKCFNVEVVSTPSERQRGLMFRETLEDNEGMLFIFEKSGRHSFWMKNTLIPLDIIWINSEKEVVYISRETPPCEGDPCPSYVPDEGVEEALYVLEIRGGLSDEIALEEGYLLEFEIG
jgi:uncharacterized protein